MPFTVLDPTTAAAAPSTIAGDPLTSVGMTLADYRADVEDDLQGRTDIADRLDGWINKAYKSLAAMLEINELYASVALSLVSTQPFYLVPECLAWITWIGDESQTNYMDGGRGFEMIDQPTYRTLPDTTTFGSPSNVLPYKYFRFARMVVIWPTPAAAFSAAVDFRVRPNSLVEDTDSTILPEEFNEVVACFAKSRACKSLGMRAEGNNWYNDGLSVLRPIINTDASEKDAMHMSMQPIRRRSQLYRSR